MRRQAKSQASGEWRDRPSGFLRLLASFLFAPFFELLLYSASTYVRALYGRKALRLNPWGTGKIKVTFPKCANCLVPKYICTAVPRCLTKTFFLHACLYNNSSTKKNSGSCHDKNKFNIQKPCNISSDESEAL